MQSILDDLRVGRNVRAEAVPGAGKTHLLVTASASLKRPTLILAYNNRLAASLTTRISAHVQCVTLHSLCSRCIHPVRDDDQLQEAVLMVTAGKVTPRDVPDVELVFIDEAQDIGGLYVSLINVLGLGDRQLCVVGDRNQLVYDFDPCFPATLETLVDPGTMFPDSLREWRAHEWNETHRLPTPVGTFVNALFNTKIEARHPGALVEVRVIERIFKLHDCLQDVIEHTDGQVMLLVDRKRNNRPLFALLNAFSRKGVAIHVHGVDDEDDVSDAKVVCHSFWSAKGLEGSTVVVIVPQYAARNPLYVALTRASKRLIVVLERREMNIAVANAVVASPNACLISAKEHAALLAGTSSSSESAVRESLSPRPRGTSMWRTLDNAVPQLRAVRQCARIDLVQSERLPPDKPVEVCMESLAVRVGLVCAEWIATGVVQAVRQLVEPTRVGYADAEACVRKGLVRWASPGISNDTLLANDLRAMALAAYEEVGEAPCGVCRRSILVALACMAWNNMDHVMRKHLPIVERIYERDFGQGVTWLVGYMSERSLKYDGRLTTDVAHCHVHATSPAACYHVVANSCPTGHAEAALRASMHPSGTCYMLVLATREVHRVCCTELLIDGLR